MSRLLGAVLAGGDSRRYGSPKEAATVGGRSLLARALAALAPSVDRLGVVGASAHVPPNVPRRDDRRPGGGPLAGLEAALAWAADEGLDGAVVLACDLPLVDTAAVARLVRAWRASTRPRDTAAVAGEPDRVQPLLGVYGVGLLPGLSQHLDRAGDRSARRWVQGVGRRIVLAPAELAEGRSLEPEFLLLNVNRPDDRALAESLVDDLPPVVSVVGWKDAGKTTVAVGLVEALTARGLRVVAVKHGHGFDIDTPGTDSWRLRHEGGAARVVLAGPQDGVVMGDWGPDGEPGLTELVRRYARDADIVVAEGWKRESVPAVEVRAPGPPSQERPVMWRPDDPDAGRFLAVVTDQPAPADAPPHLSRGLPDLSERLAALVMSRLRPPTASVGE